MTQQSPKHKESTRKAQGKHNSGRNVSRGEYSGRAQNSIKHWYLLALPGIFRPERSRDVKHNQSTSKAQCQQATQS